jgi:hypothetical protein
MGSRRWQKRVLAAGCVVVVVGLTPAAAPAAQVVAEYPANAEARTFSKNSGGWNLSRVVYSGPLCIPGVTCPSVTNSFQPSGGTAGPADGYIQSQLNGVASTFLAESEGLLHSPAFTYNAVDGKPAEELELRWSRKADVGALLDIPGNAAKYSVAIVDAATAQVPIVEPINHAALSGAPNWTAFLADIPASKLTIGGQYILCITTHYTTVATVIPSATADFDDVSLIASRKVGGGGATGLASRLKAALRESGSAKLRKRTLTFKVRCPKEASEPCRITASGHLKRRGKKATNTRTKRVPPAKRRQIKLKVKKSAVSEIQKRNKIFLRLRSRADGESATVIKRVRVR